MKVLDLKINGLSESVKGVETLRDRLKETSKQTNETSKDIQDTSESLKEMGNSGEQAVKGMMDFKEIKSTLKEIRQEMTEMLANGVEPTNEAFLKLAERAGALKDAMGDANATINRFSSDTKEMDDILGVLKTVANGFSLVTAASSLMGVEEGKLKETMVKLQAVMVLTNSLQKISNDVKKQGTLLNRLFSSEKNKETLSIIANETATKAETTQIVANNTATVASTASVGLITKAKVLWTTVTNGLNFAMKKLWVTMAANPLTAIISAIGILITLYQAFGKETDDLAEKQQDLARKHEDAVNKIISNASEMADEVVNKYTKADLEEENRINRMNTTTKDGLEKQKKAWEDYYDGREKKMVDELETERRRALDAYTEEKHDAENFVEGINKINEDYEKKRLRALDKFYTERLQKKINADNAIEDLDKNGAKKREEIRKKDAEDARKHYEYIQKLQKDYIKSGEDSANNILNISTESAGDRLVRNIEKFGKDAVNKLTFISTKGKEAYDKLFDLGLSIDEKKIGEYLEESDKLTDEFSDYLKTKFESSNKEIVDYGNLLISNSVKEANRLILNERETLKKALGGKNGVLNGIIEDDKEYIKERSRLQSELLDMTTEADLNLKQKEIDALEKSRDEKFKILSNGNETIYELLTAYGRKTNEITVKTANQEYKIEKENYEKQLNLFKIEEETKRDLNESILANRLSFNKKLGKQSVDSINEAYDDAEEAIRKGEKEKYTLIMEEVEDQKKILGEAIQKNVELRKEILLQVDALTKQRDATEGGSDTWIEYNKLLQVVKKQSEEVFNSNVELGESMKKIATNGARVAEEAVDKFGGASERRMKNLKKEWDGMNFEERFQFVSDLAVDALDGVSNMMSGIADLMQNAVDEASEKLEQLTDKETAQIDRVTAAQERITELQDKFKGANQAQSKALAIQYADEQRNLVHQKKMADELTKAKEEQAKKLEELEKKQKRKQLQSDMISALANTASSIAATMKMGFPLAIPFIAMAAANGAIQTAVIAQQLSKLGSGGMIDSDGVLHGPTHAEGGIIAAVDGKPVVEVEDKEMVINAWSTKRYMPILKALNEEGKGKNGKGYVKPISLDYNATERNSGGTWIDYDRLASSLANVQMNSVVSVVDIIEAQDRITEVREA